MNQKPNNNLDNYDAFIFDLGGVILNLEYERTFEEFKKAIAHFNPQEFYGKVELVSFYSDFEIGKFDRTKFLAIFNSYYKTNLSLESFNKCWNAMILDIPLSRVNLLLKLKEQGKRVFLLSNINEIHEDAVSKSYSLLDLKFDFFSLFEKVYYSHRIGLRKPNIEVFKYVLQEHSLKPNKVLFIDDSEQHIHAASKIGIKCIHLKKPTTLVDLPIFSGLSMQISLR